MGRHSDGMGGHCGVVAYDGGSDPLHRSASGSYPSSPPSTMESCSRQSFAEHIQPVHKLTESDIIVIGSEDILWQWNSSAPNAITASFIHCKRMENSRSFKPA